MDEPPLSWPVRVWLDARRLLKPVLVPRVEALQDGAAYVLPTGERVTARRRRTASDGSWRLVGERCAYTVQGDGTVTVHAVIIPHGLWMPADEQPTDFTVRDLLPDTER